jgi:thioredoxin reductase (NADPH)
VVIIGGGPAGLTAGLYCARANLETVLLERESLGGQVKTTHNIENYPGFLEGNAVKLIENMEKQARQFGLEIQTFEKVYKVELEGPLKKVYARNKFYSCKAIILACGLDRAELGLPREDELCGKGVSYCAVCEANFYNGKKVAVVGGGDTAIEDAIYLSKFASHVFVIHIFDELQANKVLQEAALCNDRITFVWKHKVEKILGNSRLEGIIIKDLKSKKNTKLDLDGLFIAIGLHPRNDFLSHIVELNEQGYVVVDDIMETSVPGIFAAGDMRNTPLRQVATAVGDGAIAAVSAERYLAWKEGDLLPQRKQNGLSDFSELSEQERRRVIHER